MIIPTMGYDPGVNGGIAVLNSLGTPIYLLALRPDMPEDTLVAEIGVAVTALRGDGHKNGGRMEGNVCFMEKVGYIKGDGGKGSFTFGGIYKFVRGCLLTRGVIIHDVWPTMWQSRMGCMTGGNKNVSKHRAQELFPALANLKRGHPWSITHNTADALLIARYGQLVTEVTL